MYENRLRKEDYIVRPVGLLIARIVVEKWHYSKSASKTRVYTHGLFKKGHEFFDSDCLGVAWWLPPTKVAATSAFPKGNWRKVLSLHRLVVSPEVEKNGCSFLLGKSIKMINDKDWNCLLTFADTWQNHEGTIYKATNWEYRGLTDPSPVFVNNKGRMMGKKRGPKNFTTDEMATMGFEEMGKYSKHRFTKLMGNVKQFWMVKVHPEFEGKDESTGESIIFKDWRENIVDVWANDVEHAKQVAALTGILEGTHYNDVVEVKGKI